MKIPIKKIGLLSITSAIVLFILFKTTVNWRDLGHVLASLHPAYFWLAFLTIPTTLVLCGSRWYFVLQASGFSVPFSKVLGIVLSSTSLSVIPGRLGDLARSYPLRQEIPIHKSVSTIILEKIIDVCVLCAYAGIGLWILGPRIGGILLLVIAVFSIPLLRFFHTFLGNTFISNQKGILTKLHNASAVLQETKHHKRSFVAAVGSSGLNWALSLLQTYWLFMAVGAHASMISIMAYVPLSIFIGLIPITLAGIGTRDAAFIRFFMAFANPEQSLSVGILYSLQSYVIPSLIALPFLRHFFRETTD